MFKSFDYAQDKFDFSHETVPIFASLKGTKLTLSHPKVDSTGKKFDPRSVDEGTTVLFSRHEHYDIAGSKVSLLPSTMTMKKVWSRKFPICLVLEKPNAVAEEITYNNKSTDEEDDTENVQRIKKQDSFEDVGILYLFPRTGREKEEWYNHLCRLLSDQETIRPSFSYPHYMARLVPEPNALQQSEIAWVNVIFGRAFWDVWQDKYWTNKVRERFENKLAKMKKPSFIRDITISDLNLGQSLPVITKTFPPVVDQRGTWVDLEVTYGGGLIFTLEGHLNIEGYLSYFLSLGNSEHGEVSAELEMAELSRKYEMIDSESLGADDPENDSESESPPDSDSDFESPESDLEEFTIKALRSQASDKPEDGPQSESSDYFTLSSFDGDEEFLESKDTLPSGNVSDSEVGNSVSERSAQLKRRKLSSQKQSSSEETSDKSLLTAGLSDKMSESAPCTPVKKHLGFSAKHGPKRKLFSVIERLAKSKWVKKAAETGIVKRAAERFSNLPIILSVEVQKVQGTLALNIPPPPTNRLWYVIVS